MELKIQKAELKNVGDFLDKLKLSGKLSRARIKVMKLVQEALIEMQEDIKHIQDETGVSKDLRIEYNKVTQHINVLTEEQTEKYKPLIDENKELTELLKEDAILDASKHKRLINELYIHLDDLDTELDGKEGYVHDLLLTAIEENHEDVTDQFTGDDE